MPRATYDASETWKYELTTLEGGFVELRKLSFGQMQERQELASKMAMNERNREVAVELMQRAATDYEFKNTIVDHNLDDSEGNRLNFSAPGVVGSLEPNVGREIAELIDGLNQRSTTEVENLRAESVPVS